MYDRLYLELEHMIALKFNLNKNNATMVRRDSPAKRQDLQDTK